MIERELAIQKMLQLMARAKELKETHGLSDAMALAYDYRLQGYAECINDVDAYELAWKMGRELRDMTRTA